MHCFAVKIRLIQKSLKVLKVFKRPRKPTAEKSKSENPRRKRPIVGKYGIQSTNAMAFKRTVTLRASFRFSAIRFNASTLLSFSGFTHAHAKCPPVNETSMTFAKTRFGYIEVLFHTLYCNWGRKWFRYIEVPLYEREIKIGLTPLPRF